MRSLFLILAVLVAINVVDAFAPVARAFTKARGSILNMGKAIPVKEEWVPVLKSNDIAAGDLVPVEVDGLAILVAADLDGKIFAIANSCPHLGTPLENGRLGEGSTIVCPLHKSAFSLENGEVVGDWCPFPPILGPLVLGNLAPPEKVATFPVRSKGSTIEVFIDRNLKERFESKYWAGLLDAQGKATGDYY
jgi:nitrite reductase/ring-hydroxylating ferredoxin subunit